MPAHVIVRSLLAAACGAAFAFPAAAQSTVAQPTAAQADDFFKGKTITVLIGYAPGGTYDATARLLSRYMPKHLAGNPTMVPQNMAGAGSIKAILHLYSVAPKDGTMLGMVARSYSIEPVFNPDSAKYDPTKFNPLGSSSSEVSVGVAWHTKPFKTFDDMMKQEITVGATGPTDDTGRFPVLTRNLTGAKIKVVQGYPGGNDITMAMERGEVDGRFGWSWGSVKSRSRAWLDEKKISILFQMALTKAPDLPNVPSIMEFAKTDQDRQALELLFAPQVTAWPLIAPPDVPPARVTMMRRAFDATMKDPEFVADAGKLAIEIEPVTGEDIAKLVDRISKFDRPVVDRALALTAPTAP
ncbi:MAG TPA: tripartite tricarboxylate transporter substrate-binding protein [Alphaproteobacteria bacterium]|jgi:tripartite-type tricarboxylate transporter receptor subunit TctC